MNKQYVNVSKFLSFVLRHEPHSIGLSLDSEGWAKIHTLIDRACATGKKLDLTLIRDVVDNNDKQRFEISEDGLRIRAVQGHSVESVDIKYIAQVPPNILYHGTAARLVNAILEEGLRPGERHYVHLSENKNIATSVGQRYGKPVVLKIEALLMHQQGFAFFQAQNGVWLTRHVPKEFISTY